MNRWWVALLFATGFVLFFRGWLFTGFDGIFGDDSDGEIALAIIDHWHHVFAGDTRWTDPTFFFPEPGTLGYTEAFFLLGLAHAALLRLGFDPFIAYMLVIAILSAIGYFGFVRLASRHFGVPPGYAAVGAFLFAFANIHAVKMLHVQSYCAMLLPVVGGLALDAWSSERKIRGIMLAACGGLLHGLLFLTAFQTAWFFTFFVLLFALLHPLVFGPRATLALAGEMLGPRRHVVLAYGAAFALGVVPFLVLYLPVLLAGRSRDFAEVAGNAPEWRDLLNVTTGNAVWGELLRLVGITGRPNRPMWEAELAFTPAVLAGFVIALVMLRSDRFAAKRTSDRALLLFGLAVVVLWLLQLAYFGMRPWKLVWATVPGAGGIRYVYRSQSVANLFVCLIVARGLAYAASAGLRRAAVVACVAFLMVEQINLDWPPILSRRETLAWLDAIPPAPPGCRVFYLVPKPEPGEKPYWVHQADAMLFSQLSGMPTISGYSSWFPAGWDMEDPTKPGYAAAVRDWAQRKSISGLCGLEPRRGAWTPGLPP